MNRYFFIVLFVVAIIGLPLLYIFGLRNITSSTAEKNGIKFIQAVYTDYSVVGKICQGVDTDDDGYVSCTYRIKNELNEKQIQLSCPTIFDSLLGSDCKSSQTIIVQ